MLSYLLFLVIVPDMYPVRRRCIGTLRNIQCHFIIGILALSVYKAISYLSFLQIFLCAHVMYLCKTNENHAFWCCWILRDQSLPRDECTVSSVRSRIGIASGYGVTLDGEAWRFRRVFLKTFNKDVTVLSVESQWWFVSNMRIREFWFIVDLVQLKFVRFECTETILWVQTIPMSHKSWS